MSSFAIIVRMVITIAIFIGLSIYILNRRGLI